MNYRKNDIVEITFGGVLVNATIVSFGKRTVSVIIHGTEKTQPVTKNWWSSSYYQTQVINMDSIVRVVKRTKGKKYKKRFDIKHINLEND